MEGNESSIIIAGINNAAEKAMQYYNQKQAGLVDEKAELKAKELLQNVVRCLKQVEVVNPNANKIVLPVNEDLKPQVNLLYQSLIRQVCILHQYQREKDTMGRLIATVEDMRIAGDLLFNAMVLDGDGLDMPTRRFFGAVKSYVQKKAESEKSEYWFTMQELRNKLGYSGSGSFRFISKLHRLEYVERAGYKTVGSGSASIYWDDVDKNRKQLWDKVKAQLEILSGIPSGKLIGGEPRGHMAKAAKARMPRTREFLLHA